MRILHVADLHYRRDWYKWIDEQSNNYDVLVIAGDLLSMFPVESTSAPQQTAVVMDWLETLPKPTVVCTGNHDVWLTGSLTSDGKWLQSCERPGLIVDRQAKSIEDEKFAAVKWGDTNWPADATIVVSHAPPAETQVSINAEGTDWGDFEIAMRIREKRPKYVLSGHVHQAMDWAVFEGASWCFNTGCDLKALVPNHIVIDTTKQIACWNSERMGCVTRRLIE